MSMTETEWLEKTETNRIDWRQCDNAQFFIHIFVLPVFFFVVFFISVSLSLLRIYNVYKLSICCGHIRRLHFICFWVFAMRYCDQNPIGCMPCNCNIGIAHSIHFLSFSIRSFLSFVSLFIMSQHVLCMFSLCTCIHQWKNTELNENDVREAKRKMRENISFTSLIDFIENIAECSRVKLK